MDGGDVHARRPQRARPRAPLVAHARGGRRDALRSPTRRGTRRRGYIDDYLYVLMAAGGAVEGQRDFARRRGRRPRPDVVVRRRRSVAASSGSTRTSTRGRMRSRRSRRCRRRRSSRRRTARRRSRSGPPSTPPRARCGRGRADAAVVEPPRPRQRDGHAARADAVLQRHVGGRVGPVCANAARTTCGRTTRMLLGALVDLHALTANATFLGTRTLDAVVANLAPDGVLAETKGLHPRRHVRRRARPVGHRRRRHLLQGRLLPRAAALRRRRRRERRDERGAARRRPPPRRRLRRRGVARRAALPRLRRLRRVWRGGAVGGPPKFTWDFRRCRRAADGRQQASALALFVAELALNSSAVAYTS